MRIIPTLFAATLIVFTAGPAVGGSIGSVEVGSSVEWESTCKPPARPTLFLDDIESYRQSLTQFNAYVARVGNYIKCVQADGEADIDALAAAIAKSMRKQQDAVIQASEELRTDLEVQRSLLR